MITGEEGVHAYGTDNYDVKGITLKQHMVIEFAKALISTLDWNRDVLDNGLIQTTVTKAIILSNEVIKQLNEDEKETSNSKDGVS